MAGSQLVTREAVRTHIFDALDSIWGGKSRTVVFELPQWDEVAAGLKERRNQRPKIVLSTNSLSAKERLRLQNVHEDRNTVIIVEPRVRTSTGDTSYALLSDDSLIHHARRLEACKLLLGGKPAQDAREVYQTVRDDEAKRLRKATAERYGVTILWNRAGATQTQEVDES